MTVALSLWLGFTDSPVMVDFPLGPNGKGCPSPKSNAPWLPHHARWDLPRVAAKACARAVGTGHFSSLRGGPKNGDVARVIHEVPLVKGQFVIEAIAIDIVALPMKNGTFPWFFHSYVSLPEGKWG